MASVGSFLAVIYLMRLEVYAIPRQRRAVASTVPKELLQRPCHYGAEHVRKGPRGILGVAYRLSA